MIRKITFMIMALAGFTVPAHAEKSAPVVVELFTSQSCSSCPPADKVLGKLAQQDNVIALSCNVTYWNHLHWKDTLSREFCTQRQRDYARARGNGRVYTPQMIVNGSAEFVGSRGRQAEAEIKKAAPLARIDIEKSPDGQIRATLPNLKETGNYTLWLFTYGDEHTQNIAAGENRGKTVDYTNPVTDLQKMESWSGKAETRLIEIPHQASSGIAIIVQKDNYGPVITAGKLSL